MGKESTCQCRRHEMWARSLGQEDPLEKGMATHSSILAWEISWMEEPAGLQSMGSQRAGHSWAHTLHGMAIVLCLFKFPYIVTAFLRKLLAPLVEIKQLITVGQLIYGLWLYCYFFLVYIWLDWSVCMDQVSYDQNRRNGACLPNEKLNMVFLWILKGKWSLKP